MWGTIASTMFNGITAAYELAEEHPDLTRRLLGELRELLRLPAPAHDDVEALAGYHAGLAAAVSSAVTTAQQTALRRQMGKPAL